MSRPAPEIYAPGGSFHSALAAFDAGADTVYLGLAEFSARKAAANFSFDQLRRIRSVAADRGKRIAVTVNTVVREAEIGRLVDALGRIEASARRSAAAALSLTNPAKPRASSPPAIWRYAARSSIWPMPESTR